MTEKRGTKPLTSSAFYILLALVDEPRHGLGIVAEAESRTGGDVRMGRELCTNSVKKLWSRNSSPMSAPIRATIRGDATIGSRGAVELRSRRRLASWIESSMRPVPRKCCRDAAASIDCSSICTRQSFANDSETRWSSSLTTKESDPCLSRATFSLGLPPPTPKPGVGAHALLCWLVWTSIWKDFEIALRGLRAPQVCDRCRQR